MDRLRYANATPHVTQNTSNRSPAINGRTTRHEGYEVSQHFRKHIEEYFGWAKTISGLRKSRLIGREKLDFQFVLTMAAYNLMRMRNLAWSLVGNRVLGDCGLPGSRKNPANDCWDPSRLAEMVKKS